MTFERIDDEDEAGSWVTWAAACGLLVLVLAYVAVLVWG